MIAAGAGYAEPYVFSDAWTDLPAAQVERGGFLRFPYAEMPRTFNPLLSLESNLVAGMNSYGSLGAATIGWRRPDDGVLEPRAAESWVVSDNGLTLDVVLRPELRWSDGTPITARDYQISFDLQMETGSPTARLEHWTVGEERMTFERNPYFGDWNVDAVGQPLPYLDGMSWSFMPPEVALGMFLAGELDGFRPRNLDDLGIVNAAVVNEELEAVIIESAYPIATTFFVTFNWNLATDPFKQELFRNRDFRRAVAHLVDRETIIDFIHSGAGFSLTGTIHPMLSDWYHDGLDVPAYDPDAAIALLEGIGFTGRDPDGYLVDWEGRRPGFSLVAAASTPFNVPVALLLADSARAAGLDVRVQQVAFPLLVDLFASAGDDRGFEAMFLGFSVPDAAWPFPEAVFACDGAAHVFNRSGACLFPTESLIDELARRGRATLDDDQARRIGREIQELDLELSARIFVTAPAFHFVSHGRVRGNFPLEMWNASVGSGLFFLNSVR